MGLANRYILRYNVQKRVGFDIRFGQGDIDAPVMQLTLLAGAIPIDLTGAVVEFRFLKPDETIVYQDSSTGVSIVDAANGIIECALMAQTLAVVGKVLCEIHIALNGDMLTIPGFEFEVEETIDGSGVVSENYLSRLEQGLITTAENASSALASKLAAKISEDNAKASENASELSKTNAGISENAAKASELAAKASELLADADQVAVSQTMQDFLAMLGSDVATLDGNGKLNLSQIPALTVTNTFPITDADLKIGLTNAQEGDFALVIPVDVVTDVYILAGSDYSIASNWKKLGITYVAEAGHSINADTAVNATMINNKRIVAMVQDAYDIAFLAGTLDPDTIYVVEPTPI